MLWDDFKKNYNNYMEQPIEELSIDVLRNMYKERCLRSCMDIHVVMELLGIQSIKVTLPENYKSSNEEKRRQINKL